MANKFVRGIENIQEIDQQEVRYSDENDLAQTTKGEVYVLTDDGTGKKWDLVNNPLDNVSFKISDVVGYGETATITAYNIDATELARYDVTAYATTIDNQKIDGTMQAHKLQGVDTVYTFEFDGATGQEIVAIHAILTDKRLGQMLRDIRTIPKKDKGLLPFRNPLVLGSLVSYQNNKYTISVELGHHDEKYINVNYEMTIRLNGKIIDPSKQGSITLTCLAPNYTRYTITLPITELPVPEDKTPYTLICSNPNTSEAEDFGITSGFITVS